RMSQFLEAVTTLDPMAAPRRLLSDPRQGALLVARLFPSPVPNPAGPVRDVGNHVWTRHWKEDSRKRIRARLERSGLLEDRFHLARALLALGEAKSERASQVVQNALAAANRPSAARTAPLLLLYLAQKLNESGRKPQAEVVFAKAVALMEAAHRNPQPQTL